MILTSSQFFELGDKLEPFSVFNIEFSTGAWGDKATIITIIGGGKKDIIKKELFWSPKNNTWVDSLAR